MSTFNSPTFYFTKKFLALEINNAGGFSSYSTSAVSGHVYYSNNIYDPWGNTKTHIGSFDLKSVGNTTLVFGSQTDAIGTSLQNKQRYTAYPTLYNSKDSKEPALEHFLTVVIDRPKPSDYTAPSNPTVFNFLDGYGHAGVSMTIRPYYLRDQSLIALDSIPYRIWVGETSPRVDSSFDCNVYGENVYSGRLPDVSDNYQSPNFINSSYIMPPHGCTAIGPTNSTFFGCCKYYPSAGAGGNSPRGCIPAVLMRSGCSPLTVDSSYKITYYQDNADGQTLARINNTYGNTAFPVVGPCPFLTTTYQSTTATGYYYALPSWQPDVAFRCNRGAKTSSMGPYYSSGPGMQRGGYGFYIKFNFDPLCGPCNNFY